jgi:hypothetical protein
MLWTDIEFGQIVSDDCLREAFRQSFGIPPTEVSVIADITAENPWRNAQTKIALERRLQPGEFPLHVMIILNGADLDAQVETQRQSLAMVQRLCAALQCQALISTDAIDPYEWLLISPTGDPVVVRVDPDRLDDENAFVITSRQKPGRQQAA